MTGVSALGYDHVNVLGKTLREIGYQKGGIYKVRSDPSILYGVKEHGRVDGRPCLDCAPTGRRAGVSKTAR